MQSHNNLSRRTRLNLGVERSFWGKPNFCLGSNPPSWPKANLYQPIESMRYHQLVITLAFMLDWSTSTAQPVLPQPAPSVIEAQIGDTWDEVIQRSTYKVGPLHFGGAGTIIDKPHDFVYHDPHHEMRFDNVGYTGVSLSYDTHRIDDFGIGPYRESAGVVETWQRLQDTIRKMEKAGWIPDEDRNKRNRVSRSAEELRNKYINLPGGAQGAQKIWYDEFGNEAWVSLVKTITGREPGEEPRFNIVLNIQVATHPKKPTAQK